MPIYPPSWFYVLLIVSGLVSSFAATGAVAAGWLLVWLGATVWLEVGKPQFSWTRSVLPNLMLGFLLWISASVWWSPFPYSSWYVVLILGALPISFIAWQLTPNQDEIWGHLQKVFVVGVWLVSLWGIYQVVILGLPRALGPVADPNVYACLLNLAWFPLLSVYFKSNSSNFEKSRFTQLILGVTLLLVGLAFFSAASRGATLAWVLLMPLALWAFRHQPNFLRNTLVVLSIATASYFIVAAITQIQLLDRADAAYLEQDSSVALRLNLWRTTAEMFWMHPWLGTGLGTWGGVYPAYRQTGDNSTAGYYVHNDYLQIAQEGGVATFILFVLIFFSLALFLIRLVFSSKQRPIQIENIGLMLGVIAAYLHASVNFIFYLVYLNIIIGLYAARAWQSSKEQRCLSFSWPKSSGSGLRWFVLLIALVIPLTQIVLHETSETFLNRQSRSLTLLRKLFPQLTPYDIAHFIAAIRPNEYIAQRYLAESAAQALDDVNPNESLLKQEILQETIELFDKLRRHSTNSADLGAEEAKLILRNRYLMRGSDAIQKARSVAQAALLADPRHVASTIVLAESYYLEGKKAEGDKVLSRSISNMIFLRDRLVLQAELLKYQNLHENVLNDIQEKLRNIRFSCRVGDCQENRALEEEQQARLRKLASSIMPFSDAVISQALASLVHPEW